MCDKGHGQNGSQHNSAAALQLVVPIINSSFFFGQRIYALSQKRRMQKIQHDRIDQQESGGSHASPKKHAVKGKTHIGICQKQRERKAKEGSSQSDGSLRKADHASFEAGTHVFLQSGIFHAENRLVYKHRLTYDNHFNFAPFSSGYFLLTNDFGAYSFLTKQDIRALLSNTLDPDSEIYSELRENGFLLPDRAEEIAEETVVRYRKAKGYLLSSTSLHIFVLTNACNLNCVYCQARDHEHVHVEKMSFETAEKAVMTALQSPEHYLNFEFQGGEPLLNYPVIRHIVEYAEKNKQAHSIQYSVVTNLTLLSDEMLDFFEQYDVRISTSLDGNSELHNANRSDRLGVGFFENVVAAIKEIQARNLPIGAIQTTTRQSFSKSKQIIDTYRELGFQSVFIRPLTKLGTAIPNWNEIGYSASEFVQFYRECLSYILELNKQGKPFSEGHAGIFLSKILSGQAQNYMELRSPCGAAIGQAAYYFNGDVYTCDEGRMIAEMGDSAFKLGNVYKNSYDEMMSSPVCKTVCAASVLESLPECTDCVYQPYCGTCPALNYASEHNVFKRDARGYRCQI